MLREIVTGVLLAVLLSSCSGGDAGPTEEMEPVPTSSSSPAPTADCEPAAKGWGEMIAEGSQDGWTMAVSDVAAMPWPQDPTWILYAARFTVNGEPSPETGVWASKETDPLAGGLLFSAGGAATAFSVWPRRYDLVMPTQDEIELATSCLR